MAIVTGGGMGLGRALCGELARQGATVIAADIAGDMANQVAAQIEQSGGKARAAQIDVSNIDEVLRLVDQTIADLGRLDYMFNNAAIVIGGDARDLRCSSGTASWTSTSTVSSTGRSPRIA